MTDRSFQSGVRFRAATFAVLTGVISAFAAAPALADFAVEVVYDEAQVEDLPKAKKRKSTCPVTMRITEFKSRLFVESDFSRCKIFRNSVVSSEGAVAEVFAKSGKLERYSCVYTASNGRERCSNGINVRLIGKRQFQDGSYKSDIRAKPKFASRGGTIFVERKVTEQRNFDSGTKILAEENLELRLSLSKGKCSLKRFETRTTYRFAVTNESGKALASGFYGNVDAENGRKLKKVRSCRVLSG